MAQATTKIEDYAFLSDTQTGALVSRDGCVDWLCFPRFDSPACFASLLGEKENGHWRFFPDEEVTAVRRRYRGETLILETELETKNGAVRLIDFMPPRGENPDIIRIIEGLRGKVSMQMELIIRFDYGQIVPWVRRLEEHDGLEAIAGPEVTPDLAKLANDDAYPQRKSFLEKAKRFFNEMGRCPQCKAAAHTYSLFRAPFRNPRIFLRLSLRE